jgi:hypothetical protein
MEPQRGEAIMHSLVITVHSLLSSSSSAAAAAAVVPTLVLIPHTSCIYVYVHIRYVLDEAMADRLKSSNPEAFRNILKRMLEANGRGFWKGTLFASYSTVVCLCIILYVTVWSDSADPSVLETLQNLFDEVEDELEGV